MVGRERVLLYLLGLAARPEAAGADVEIAEVNGEAAVLVRRAGSLVLVPELADGRVVAVRIVVNPAKLAFAAHHPGSM